MVEREGGRLLDAARRVVEGSEREGNDEDEDEDKGGDLEREREREGAFAYVMYYKKFNWLI